VEEKETVEGSVVNTMQVEDFSCSVLVSGVPQRTLSLSARPVSPVEAVLRHPWYALR
jgi:hypothetical protein